MLGQITTWGALVLWGIWGFTSFKAVERAHPFTIQWIISLPYVLLGPAWYYWSRRVDGPSLPDRSTFLWALASCFASLSATVLYNTAMKTEKPSVVIALTSAYPVFTFIIFILVGIESFKWQHFIAFCLIFAGVALLQIPST